MCRGCEMEIDGQSQLDEYLDFLNEYQKIGRRMQELEKRLAVFEKTLDKGGPRVGKFRRGIIRNRRSWNGLHTLMD